MRVGMSPMTLQQPMFNMPQRPIAGVREHEGLLYNRVPTNPEPSSSSKFPGLDSNPTSGREDDQEEDDEHIKEEEALLAESKLGVWISEGMAQVAALQQYSVICVVLSGFAFTGLVGLDHARIREESNWRFAGIHVGSALVFSMTLAIATCIGTGLHATLIFALCSIYGSTAVSHGDQEGFTRFMLKTGMIRFWAFRAFKASIVSMFFSILLLLMSKLPFLYAAIVGIPTGIVMAIALWDALAVIAQAGHLFRPRPELEKNAKKVADSPVATK